MGSGFPPIGMCLTPRGRFPRPGLCRSALGHGNDEPLLWMFGRGSVSLWRYFTGRGFTGRGFTGRE